MIIVILEVKKREDAIKDSVVLVVENIVGKVFVNVEKAEKLVAI